MLYGVSPGHIRILCSSPLEGGYGYDPIRVGEFTLDQIFMLLCDKAVLRMGGKERIEKVSTVGAMSSIPQNPGGKFAGRSASGKSIQAEIKGKSKARALMEAQEREKNAKAQAERDARRASEARRKKNQRPVVRGD